MEAHGGHPLDPRVLYVDLTADYSSLEDWGLHLFNSMAARFRAALFDLEKDDPRPLRSSTAIPEGPHFVYEAAPRLFHTRRGRGPLFIVWDTNILIDYFKYGRALWEGDSLPDFADGDYAGELEGLQMLIALWVLRDIRFVILPASINDAKKRLSIEHRTNRIRAFEEFASALSLVSGGPSGIAPPSREGLLILPDSPLEDAVANLPQGFDRTLARSAARMGIHAFMTMDKGILKQRAALKAFGLLLASPLDLLEELITSGAFHCMLAPRFANWPMPDQMRVGHLIRALPAFD
ncbi:hypothetical protein ACIBQ6_34505 [Nonomuraea sp. NPDC049655]|uniref:hypothetical protein n=1 Tax=Nonomuraea sp. NPDC049655 TaxID=3364355 RepID=UPI0037B81DDD